MENFLGDSEIQENSKKKVKNVSQYSLMKMHYSSSIHLFSICNFHHTLDVALLRRKLLVDEKKRLILQNVANLALPNQNVTMLTFTFVILDPVLPVKKSVTKYFPVCIHVLPNAMTT